MRTSPLNELPDAGTLSTILALAADEMLTPQQAADELRLSRQTIYNWIHDADNPLPATKAGGWRIRRGDLARYVEQKHNPQERVEPERTSDQTLRAYLLQLLEVGRAAVEFRHSSQVFQAAQTTGFKDKDSFAFLERCSDDLTAKREQLLSASAGLDDETLTRLRFMLPSITSSLTISAPGGDDERGVTAPREVSPLPRQGRPAGM
jgi:excisionase family DNA binding protein